MSDKIEISNYIQRKLNECNYKEINRFVNPAFTIEEGSGYFKALMGIKKGLIKKGLWEITIEEDENSKIDTQGWIKKDQ